MHAHRMFILYFSGLYVLVIALFTLTEKCGVSLYLCMHGPFSMAQSHNHAHSLPIEHPTLLLGDHHRPGAVQADLHSPLG